MFQTLRRRAMHGTCFLSLFVLSAWVLSGTALRAADPIKLNGPLVAGGRVSRAQFSPDGSRVAYTAEQNTVNVQEIFSVPSGGGMSVKLNGPLVANGDVQTFGTLFSPDGNRVLYLADQNTDNVFEIYAVPSTGGTSVKLNGTLVTGGDVQEFGLQFSSDGSRVLYQADQTTDNVLEIFSVPSGGGTATKLNGTLVAGGNVGFGRFYVSPNGSRVLYLADQVADEVYEIFSVPSAGGAATKLNGALVAGGDVQTFGLQFSPDGSRVLYNADQNTDEVYEIYSVPSTGGAATKLNGALVAGGNVFFSQFSPDGSQVLYNADQVIDEVYEIFIVPSTGGTPTKLNGPLVAGGYVDTTDLKFSPDGSRVLYVADQDTDEVFELYSVPATGGTPVKLNAPLVAGGGVTISFGNVKFSPDGSRVLYGADQDTDEVFELYSVPATGGTPVKLNAPLVGDGDVLSFFDTVQFSPDGSRVLYVADQDTNNVNEFYIVPSEGGTPLKVNGPLVAGGSVDGTSARFSADGSLILYLADQDTNDVTEAYARVVRLQSNSGTGSWDLGSSWNYGVAPDEVMQVIVTANANVIVSGASTRTAYELQVGTGSGTATLTLESDAAIAAQHGVTTIDAGGVLRGDGQVLADVVEVRDGGAVHVVSGERLMFSGSSLANSGLVDVIGNSGNLAEAVFDGQVINSVATGFIAARNAILRFQSGLVNHGSLAVSFGATDATDVFGDVTNSASGTIAVAGNSGVTFYDDVTNSGTLNVHAGSTAVFFGALAGNGNVGGGDVQALGDLLPGASPGTMVFGGNLAMGPLTNLEIQLGGTAGGQFDRLIVAGSAVLDGSLNAELVDGFSLSQGQSFTIVDIGGTASGAFSGLAEGDLVGSFGGTELFITYAGGNGNDVALFTAGLAGDYNEDGTVNAADYTLWRDNLGSGTSLPNDDTAGVGPDDYTRWKTHFGETAGSGSGATGSASALAAVPEPASQWLIGLAIIALACYRPTRND